MIQTVLERSRTDHPHERGWEEVMFNKGGSDDFGLYLLQYRGDPKPCILWRDDFTTNDGPP